MTSCKRGPDEDGQTLKTGRTCGSLEADCCAPVATKVRDRHSDLSRLSGQWKQKWDFTGDHHTKAESQEVGFDWGVASSSFSAEESRQPLSTSGVCVLDSAVSCGVSKEEDFGDSKFNQNDSITASDKFAVKELDLPGLKISDVISSRNSRLNFENDLGKSKDDVFDECQLNWELIFEQDQDGDTQLHIALMLDAHVDFAMTVINLCPDPELLDLQNDRLQTVLHLAVILHRLPVIQALVSRNTRLFICDENGNTPLHLSCQMGYTDAVHMLTDSFKSQHQKFLLKKIIHHRNYEGLTCCHLSAKSPVLDNLFHLIQDCSANINVQEGKRGMTVLHMAAESNNTTLVAFLIFCPEINLNKLTYDGWTALDIAVGRRLAEMEKLLYSAGALQSEKNENYSSGSESGEQTEEETDADDVKL